MDTFTTIVFCLVILGLVVALIMNQYYKLKAAEYMNMPKEAPLIDDCIWQTKKMVGFVSDRLKEADKDPFADVHKGQNRGLIGMYDSHDLVDFVRTVHQAGCQIIIKQVAKEDIENPNNTKEVLKEYHTDLRRARDERLKEKYSRGY